MTVPLALQSKTKMAHYKMAVSLLKSLFSLIISVKAYLLFLIFNVLNFNPLLLFTTEETQPVKRENNIKIFIDTPKAKIID